MKSESKKGAVGLDKDMLDELDAFVHRCNNGLSFSNLALIERYAKGDVRVAVKLVVHPRGAVEGMGREYLATFESAGDIGATAGPFGSDKFTIPLNGAYIIGGNQGPHKDNALVFVNSVDLMKQPKEVVPSFVWLQPLDECKRVTWGSLYFSKTAGFETFEGVVDRKSPEWVSQIRVGVAFPNERTGQIIEGRSELVGNVADHYGKYSGNFPFDIDTVIDFRESIRRVRIRIGENHVGLTVDESLNLPVQFGDVFFGPF